MKKRLGIKREEKSQWERRTPLVPSDIEQLAPENLSISFEPSEKRTFSDEAYRKAGAVPSPGLDDCQVILGIKEMRPEIFKPHKTYVFFSHTIKGQPHNMPMLARLAELGCTLIDYELITDDHGRRLIFFGRFAGYAGMIDTFHTVGRRMAALGIPTPFESIRMTHEYTDLEDAQNHVRALGAQISKGGIPEALRPFVVGIAGYGNVSGGAQEILDLLPHETVEPEELEAFIERNRQLADRVVKVVYREEHMVRRKNGQLPFDLPHYFAHGEQYESKLEPQLKLLNVLVNAIFWTSRYPRLASADVLERLFDPRAPEAPRLTVVGDISCDIDGAMACTVRDAHPGNPVYIYNPHDKSARDGFDGDGLAVMAVGNLPCELPAESSQTFSTGLAPLMPELSCFNDQGALEDSGLSDLLQRAVILWRGRLTPAFEYLQQYL